MKNKKKEILFSDGWIGQKALSANIKAIPLSIIPKTENVIIHSKVTSKRDTSEKR